MKVSIAIETSQPCGKIFRLAVEVSVPLALISAVLGFVGLN